MDNKAKILCPICKCEQKPLLIEVPNACIVDFDMRKFTHITYCDNCKRKIKYRFIVKNDIGAI